MRMKSLFASFALLVAVAVTIEPAFNPTEGDLAPRAAALKSDEASGGAVALFGCTPKREAATAEIAQKKSKCVADELAKDLNRPPAQILLACAVPKDSSDWANIFDLIVGAQVAAMNAGVQLPNATEAAGLAHPPSGVKAPCPR